ncbi:muscleblind-like protein 1 isoform X2 [Gigantopelta aegis]|uniref:muscleblind-like protein 1 isoform X2 n=1 Tax=Gigantopelta aegis TaxID=1735272 RepID=UPI001B88A616|nr:muscleblind-like protein 1 isoform X2 [Gigantopelta aegis]
MAMVNQMMNLQPAPNPNVKDSRWLTLEVCREFQRSKCTRTENECKFAHPPPHVEVQNGRVIACFDSIKGKCQRKDPPCKYLHPPQHLREQLLQNGRNNLILRNLQLQAAQAALQPFVPGMIPVAGNKLMAYPAGLPSGQYPIVVPPYVGSVPNSAMPSYNPYLNSMPTISVPGSESSGLVQQQVSGVIPTSMPAQTQKMARPDRLEVCREFQRGTCTRQPNECRFAHPPENVTVESTDNHVTVCMDFVKGKCARDSCRYFHPPSHLQAQIKAAQQRVANASVATAPSALPQVVEVLTAGKKRPRDPTDDLVLGALPAMVPPYKRMAMTDSKSGIPMTYQPINAYQHAALMQLGQQQQYIPVTWQLTSSPVSELYTIAGHPPSVPRF